MVLTESTTFCKKNKLFLFYNYSYYTAARRQSRNMYGNKTITYYLYANSSVS